MDDAELTAEALAADPDAVVGDDAVPIWEVLEPEPGRTQMLPEWYMPVTPGGGAILRGWRRAMALVVVGALLLITAYGPCNTYGQLVLG